MLAHWKTSLRINSESRDPADEFEQSVSVRRTAGKETFSSFIHEEKDAQEDAVEHAKQDAQEREKMLSAACSGIVSSDRERHKLPPIQTLRNEGPGALALLLSAQEMS